MVKSGYDISTLFACGGLCKSDLFLQTHADITGEMLASSRFVFQSTYCENCLRETLAAAVERWSFNTISPWIPKFIFSYFCQDSLFRMNSITKFMEI